MLRILAVVVLLILLLCWCSGTGQPLPGYETGTGDGPRIVIIAGLHGDERAGPELLQMPSTRVWLRRFPARILVIPVVNGWGYARNVRARNPLGADLNREFADLSDEAAALLSMMQDADLVIDLHEGWGWHVVQPASIGSTVTPIGPVVDQVCDPLVAHLNAGLPAPRRWRVRRTGECDLPGSLGCYFERRLPLEGRHPSRLSEKTTSTTSTEYLLVETTGQNDVQPMAKRLAQLRTILATVLIEYPRLLAQRPVPVE